MASIAAPPVSHYFSLGSLFHKGILKGRAVVVLKFYMDETEGSEAYFIAGWASLADRWDEIAMPWQETLDTHPRIAYLRANEALGLKGQFEGWSEHDRDNKLVALAKTLPHTERVFFGTGAYVKKKDFEAIKPKIRRIYRSPYYFLAAVVMVYSAASETQVIGVDELHFVLDRSTEAQRMCRLFYGDIKGRFSKLGECIHLDDKQTPHLQMADLHAAFVREVYDPEPKRIAGVYAAKGINTHVLELEGKALHDMIDSPMFRWPPKS